MLVNDIWGAEMLKGGPADWNTPIWEHDLDTGLRILRLAIDTHLDHVAHLLPLLIDRPGGLLVEVTDGTQRLQRVALPDLGLLRPGQGRGEPAGVLPGPRARAIRRDRGRRHAGLAALRDDARRLRRHRGELARRARSGSPLACRSAPPDFALSESPRYVGRAVAALAADPDRARWNQQSVTSGELAHDYGFTDVDGSQPDIWRYIEEVRERGLEADLALYR